METTAPRLVRDRMQTQVITARPDASIRELTRLLRKNGISAVPITKGPDSRELLGIVSTTDILSKVPLPVEPPSVKNVENAPLLVFDVDSKRAGDIMSTQVVTATPDESIDEAAWRLVAGRVHRLVVVKNGTEKSAAPEVAGILSLREILAEISNRRAEAVIGTIMSSPPQTIDIGDSIDSALTRLATTSIHGFVVMDGSSPVGVFTHAEAIAAREIVPELRTKNPVEEVMSYETICLNAATPIYRAAAYTVAMNVKRILVVESRQLVGILSPIDLVGVLARTSDVAVAR